MFTGPAAAAAAAEEEEKEEDKKSADHKQNTPTPAASSSNATPGPTPADADDALPALRSRPFMVRQPTDEDVQYGDILVVKLSNAKNLIAVDWNGSSDPYALLSVDKQSSRSSIIKKKVNPVWNETFFFHIGLEADAPAMTDKSQPITLPKVRSKRSRNELPKRSTRHLTVLLFDHDWVGHDESLGYFEILIDDIPRDTYIERTYQLQGVKNGEVQLTIQRSTITSPQMRAVLKSLTGLARPIKQADLESRGVTLEQLLGKEPYLSLPAALAPKKRSLSGSSLAFGGPSIQHIPALAHLASLLSNPSARFNTSNIRTLAKITFILRTQRVIDLSLDLPTRFVWISNLNQTNLSPSNLFLTLRKHFPNRIKRIVIPPASRSGCLYVWFKRIEDAILALFTLLDMPPVRACFGQAFEPAEDHLLCTVIKSGILSIAGPIDATANQSDAGNAAMSDDLPSALNPSSASAASGLSAPGSVLVRANSNCTNDAPVQKGKHALAWSSYWVIVAPGDADKNLPPILYALRKTSDLNAAEPEKSKWAFRIELTPKACVVTRSGPCSIQIVAFNNAKKVGNSNPAVVDGDSLPPSDSPVLGRQLTLPADPAEQSTFYIRVQSSDELDDWLGLLKACRSGETILSPRKPNGAAGFARGFLTPNAAAPETSSPYDQVTTRVFCSACNTSKSVLDIYTLDAALDVVPTSVDPSAAASAADSSLTPADSNPAIDTSLPSSPLGAVPFPITQFCINSCRECLVSSIRSKMLAGQFGDLSAEFTVNDVRDLLPRAQFDDFLDRSTSHLIDDNPHKFVRCPKCACPIEIDHHSWASKSEHANITGLVGIDKKPLEQEAIAAFIANRFLCRGCRTDFCRLCKSYPFHPGYTCAEYSEYLTAPKCRYCARSVTSRTKMPNPPGLAFQHVCNEDECKAKVDLSCRVVKRCGHPCPGARDELDCPPCMQPECEERDPKADCADETCAICYTEELGQAPIIKLACGHIFHIECVRARLTAKWSTPRISFEFTRCPLCVTPMQHALLTPILRPFYHLESQVRAMSMQRLEFEEMTNHVDIVTPEGRFYQKPEEFAVDHYMVTQTHIPDNQTAKRRECMTEWTLLIRFMLTRSICACLSLLSVLPML